MPEPTPESNLQSILRQESLKWIFVGGKGGVGKTTCSCSLAIQLAAVRSNVLIISTDPAHNLSDAFRQKFSRTPALVEGFDNLFAMEIDPTPEDSELQDLNDESGSFLNEIASSIPGVDEAMSFAEVMRQVQTMEYSVVVFDTAPTGHTLRLLQFPQTLEKGLEKLMSFRGAMGGMIDQMLMMFGGGGSGGMQEGIFAKLEGLKAVVDEIIRQFKDPERTTFVCVCIPEFLSLYETERLVQELARHEMDSNNIIINQTLQESGTRLRLLVAQVIFEEEVGGSKLLRARVRMQQKYLEQYEELYDDFHLVKLPLLEEEVRGTPSLKAFSENLIHPFQPQPKALVDDDSAALKSKVAQLEQRCKDLEVLLASKEKLQRSV